MKPNLKTYWKKGNEILFLKMKIGFQNELFSFMIIFLYYFHNNLFSKLSETIFYLRLFVLQVLNFKLGIGHICNHPHGQENHTQKYINTVLITV